MNYPEAEQHHLRTEPTQVGAVVRMRCPECKKGIVYSHGSHMNRLCPNCGIRFEREPGYFSGAIWIAVLLATPVALFLMFLLLWFFRELHPGVAGLLASLTFIPLVPITIRLSRSIWMYLDHQMHPQRPHRDPPDRSDIPPAPISPDPPGRGASMPVDPSDGAPSDEGIPTPAPQRKQEMAEV